MAQKITQIIRIIDMADLGYMRIVEKLQKPYYLKNVIGDPDNLIPDDATWDSSNDPIIEEPLFNKSGNMTLTEDLPHQGILFLELRTGYRLANLSFTPEPGIHSELLLSKPKNNLIFGFYNGSTQPTITIKAAGKTDAPFVQEVLNHQYDQSFREYYLKKCLYKTPVKQKFGDYLTSKELAEYLAKSVQTIYNWKSKGKIVPDKNNGHPLFSKEKIDEQFKVND